MSSLYAIYDSNGFIIKFSLNSEANSFLVSENFFSFNVPYIFGGALKESPKGLTLFKSFYRLCIEESVRLKEFLRYLHIKLPRENFYSYENLQDRLLLVNNNMRDSVGDILKLNEDIKNFEEYIETSIEHINNIKNIKDMYIYLEWYKNR